MAFLGNRYSADQSSTHVVSSKIPIWWLTTDTSSPRRVNPLVRIHLKRYGRLRVSFALGLAAFFVLLVVGITSFGVLSKTRNPKLNWRDGGQAEQARWNSLLLTDFVWETRIAKYGGNGNDGEPGGSRCALLLTTKEEARAFLSTEGIEEQPEQVDLSAKLAEKPTRRFDGCFRNFRSLGDFPELCEGHLVKSFLIPYSLRGRPAPTQPIGILACDTAKGTLIHGSRQLYFPDTR